MFKKLHLCKFSDTQTEMNIIVKLVMIDILNVPYARRKERTCQEKRHHRSQEEEMSNKLRNNIFWDYVDLFNRFNS